MNRWWHLSVAVALLQCCSAEAAGRGNVLNKQPKLQEGRPQEAIQMAIVPFIKAEAVGSAAKLKIRRLNPKEQYRLYRSYVDDSVPTLCGVVAANDCGLPLITLDGKQSDADRHFFPLKEMAPGEPATFALIAISSGERVASTECIPQPIEAIGQGKVVIKMVGRNSYCAFISGMEPDNLGNIAIIAGEEVQRKEVHFNRRGEASVPLGPSGKRFLLSGETGEVALDY